MDLSDDREDKGFEEMMKDLLKRRKPVRDPLTDEDATDIRDEWINQGLGDVDIEIEQFHLGCDEDGYIISGHVTPIENNKSRAYFFILKDDNYKRTGNYKYRIEFVSAFDEEEEEEEEPYTDMICQSNNLFSGVVNMIYYWKSFLLLE